MCEDEGKVWYFAYGSNLCKGVMTSRIGQWTESKKAELSRHKLVFNVCSKRWGGFAANIEKTGDASAKVHGAVYCITKQQLDVLTCYESVEPKVRKVKPDGGVPISAKVYIFGLKGWTQEPPDVYLNTMLCGLRQHGYSEEVIKEVEGIAHCGEGGRDQSC